VLSGDDELTLPLMGLGGAGVISVAAHVAGKQMREMVDSQAAGEHTRALSLHLRMLPLFKALFMTANPIMVKDALAQQGFPVGECRLPLVPPTAEQSAELARVLTHLDLK
jgi:4-hydroxy-tetrahydrodipicolinate synthase